MEASTTLTHGINRHMSGDLEGALEIYSKLYKSGERGQSFIRLLSLLYFQRGDFDLLEPLMREHKDIFPTELSRIFSSSWYYKHISEERGSLAAQQEERIDENSVGNWRQLQMLSGIEHIGEPNSPWLTLGDAYGHDAIRLKSMGKRSVTASNLTGLSNSSLASLEIDSKSINAEQISLPDNSFDYLLCKEALHHMTRPYLAIYEMLRVAKRAVVLIEPLDILIDYRAPEKVNLQRSFVQDDNVGEVVVYSSSDGNPLIRRYVDWWEDGAFNYVYTLSIREIRKVCLGAGLPCFATRQFNDFYDPAFNTQSIEPPSEGYIKTIEQVNIHNSVCKENGIPYSHVTAVLFKLPPNRQEVAKLRGAGFDLSYVPTRFLPRIWCD